MATIYTFKYTNTLKTGFIVSPYTTNGTLSPSDSNLLPTSVLASTSLKLYGKGMQEYGEGIEQNLIYMLENFANSTAPLNAIEGQTWYTLIGSPPTSAELSIYNGSTWDKVLLDTGISPMSATFDMGGNIIINAGDAVNPTDVLNIQTGDTLYVNVLGDTMTGNLFLSSSIGSPTTPLSITDPSHAIHKQYADDNYVNITGDAMTGALVLRANIGAGSPVDVLEAASIEYVDSKIATNADSYLSNVSFQSSTGASVPTGTDDEILFTIVGQPAIAIGGINFVGQTKPAVEITTTSTGDIPSGTAQNAINLLESKKLDKDGSDSMSADLNLAGNAIINLKEPVSPQDAVTKSYVDIAVNVITSVSEIEREIVVTTATDTYQVFKHGAGLNKLQLSLNGQIQYTNSIGFSNIVYDPRVDEINVSTLTTLDANTNYSFDITVDGGSPLTTQTIELNIGSPSTSINTHGELIAAINVELFDLSGLYPRMSLVNINNSETITSPTIGASSTVIIGPPTTGTGTYLFDIPAPITVTAVTLGSSSPIAPDTLTVSGDQTASFPIGKTFTLRDTTTDGTTGTVNDNFDSVYTVSSSTASSSPIETVIELVEEISLIGTNITGFGNIYLTNLSGLSAINQVDGADYDYTPLSSLDGTDIPATYSNIVNYIKFNTTPPTGQTLELILLP